MNSLIRILLVMFLLFAMMAGVVCSFVLAGDIDISESDAGSQTIENLSSNDSNSESGSEASIEEGDDYSYESSFSAAEGTETVQLGSSLLGGITVSNDNRPAILRKNVSTVASLEKAGLISKEDAKEYAEYTLEELKKESKQSKCLWFIPCGKDRRITNLFKLL